MRYLQESRRAAAESGSGPSPSAPATPSHFAASEPASEGRTPQTLAKQQHSLTIAYLFTSCANVVWVVLGAVSGLIASRALQPVGRGELAVISYFPSLLGALFCFGTPQALTYFLSQDLTAEKELASAGLRIGVISGAIGCIIFALIAPRSMGVGNQHLAHYVAINSSLAIFMVVTPHLTAIHIGMRRIVWANSVLICGALAYVMSLVALWYYGDLSPLSASLTSLGIQAAMGVAHCLKLGYSALTHPVSNETYVKCLTQGLRFFVPGAALILLSNSERIILMRTTTLEQIGFFAVASALTFPITLATEAFAQVGFVEIASQRHGPSSIDLMLRRFRLSQIPVAAAAMGAAVLIPGAVIFGFGREFRPAVMIAYPLVGTMALRALSKALENGMRANNHIWPGAASAVLSVLCLVVFGGYLSKVYGALGFAAATVIAQSCYLACIFAFLIQRYSLLPTDLHGLRLSQLRILLSAIRRLVPAQ